MFKYKAYTKQKEEVDYMIVICIAISIFGIVIHKLPWEIVGLAACVVACMMAFPGSQLAEILGFFVYGAVILNRDSPSKYE